ncbi:hypothetical protein HRM2_31210 [Desulforapulum autotrophicum HRM2]|uniref:DUF1573 domain-containing protein n=1 Tax=Desulforapulum autotrophicum (strain ATCC 43914 / DSM 3382 / VKM B-1955 / HRM2) TaxID=177437 RepID=C0QKW4_DESAH|nr:DUF1573 domain-containing protein [Desulforapulum autotrophicum]ACN16204.1 hypothetical protein HRM2_31210 [Desulforapulum autotrophicum HRM2]
MKKLLLTLLTLAVLGLWGVQGVCAAAPAADAVVLEPDFSFGTIAEGKKAIHTFMIENRGETELRVLRVETG